MSASTAGYPAALTARQDQVLSLIGLGLTNREIGGRLGIAEKTVKNTVTVVLAKLGFQRRAQAAIFVTVRRLAADQAMAPSPGLTCPPQIEISVFQPVPPPSFQMSGKEEAVARSWWVASQKSRGVRHARIPADLAIPDGTMSEYLQMLGVNSSWVPVQQGVGAEHLIAAG